MGPLLDKKATAAWRKGGERWEAISSTSDGKIEVGRQGTSKEVRVPGRSEYGCLSVCGMCICTNC